MERATYNAAAQAAAVAGFASLFLPSIESTWTTDNADPYFGQALDSGTVLYLGLALGVGGLHSLAAGSPFPLIVSALIAFIVVLHFRRAFDAQPGKVEDDS